MEHHHSATCPRCGNQLSAESKESLISKLQEHAKENHDMELSREQAEKLAEGE